MNTLALIFFVVNALSLISVPRSWAAIYVILGACYTPLNQSIEIGALHFPVLRLLLFVGVLRLLIRRDEVLSSSNTIDRLVVVWGLWAVSSSFLHDDVLGVLINRLGMLLNVWGIYFLLRCTINSSRALTFFSAGLAVILAILAIEMSFERFSGTNLFSLFGGLPESPDLRGGTYRAQGPFAHAILAGTIGATSLPLLLPLLAGHRLVGSLGLTSCIVIVVLSASSGPIMSTAFSLLALMLWPWRRYTFVIPYMLIAAYIILDFLMSAPAYYLIARIDLTGSSTSWHRAALIDTAIVHLREWYLAGTDYTRHWMPYGVAWSTHHIDITNYYLRMGVDGGLPLMIIFIAILGTGFARIRTNVDLLELKGVAAKHLQFQFWAVGASLFSHCASFLSVSYFDQSFIFLYLSLAAIAALEADARHIVWTATILPTMDATAVNHPTLVSTNAKGRSKIFR